jgi:glycosyltransferase involved in cell wall biosynthesis
MKVAMICDYPINEMISGGVARHIIDLTNNLAANDNIELHIISLADEDRTFQYSNKHFHLIKRNKIGVLYFYDLIKIRDLLKSIQPAIVHIQTTAYSFLVLMSNKQVINQTILSVHGIYSLENKYNVSDNIFHLVNMFMLSLLELKAVRKVKHIIVPSMYARIVMESINPKCNICVIPSGVDVSYFNIIPNEHSGRLLYVGNITKRKGLLDLIKAMKLVAGKIPAAKLHVVGNIVSMKYFKMVTKLIIQNKLESNIKILGYLNGDQLQQEYSEAQVFVLPSYEESLGIVLIEAMASGKAIIASDAASIPYVIDDNITGLLYQSGDTAELAKKIIELLLDDKMRRQLSEAAVEKARMYDWKRVSDDTYNVYENVLKPSAVTQFFDKSGR